MLHACFVVWVRRVILLRQGSLLSQPAAAADVYQGGGWTMHRAHIALQLTQYTSRLHLLYAHASSTSQSGADAG